MGKREVHVTPFLKNWQSRNYWYETIPNSFKKSFVKIGPDLASKIPKSNANFEAYISKGNTKLHENPLTKNELLKAFKSSKISKAASFDQIDVTVINQIYNHIKKHFIRFFGDSIKLWIFPEKLKLAKVTSIFKSGKSKLLTNYRPISVLPCFS